MYYILCAQGVFEHLPLGPPGGLAGGGCRGAEPTARGFGGSAPEKKIRADILPGRHITDNIFPGPHDIRWFFGTWFFADGFLFPS
jgi:hypothetical protein